MSQKKKRDCSVPKENDTNLFTFIDCLRFLGRRRSSKLIPSTAANACASLIFESSCCWTGEKRVLGEYVNQKKKGLGLQKKPERSKLELKYRQPRK